LKERESEDEKLRKDLIELGEKGIESAD